jgi:hypothetical protein
MEMTETMKLTSEMTAQVLPWMQNFHKAFPGQRYLARTVQKIVKDGAVEAARYALDMTHNLGCSRGIVNTAVGNTPSNTG